MPRWAWFTLAGAIVAADRAAKLAVLATFAPGERLVVTPFFNLVLVFNPGAAFSLLAGASGWQREFLLGVAAVAVVVVSALLWRHAAERLFAAALALILGGAVGNAWDRLQWGQVVDFLDLHAYGWHWPVFNLADAAITIGALALIADSLRRRPDGSAK